MTNYWLSKTSEEIFTTFPHNQIVAWLYQTARFIVSDLATKERQLELWQRLVRELCDLAEKHLDFGDDVESFEKAILISNPYHLEKIDTQGMKPGWAELAALKQEALVDMVVTNMYQPPHRHPLYRVCAIARACATTVAQRDHGSEEMAQADLHDFLLRRLADHGFRYQPVTLIRDITVQSHSEIAHAPYAMREYYFHTCSSHDCPDNRSEHHAHLMVWNTSFWMEPEEFPPIHSLAEGQRFITEQFGEDKLHPRNLSNLVTSLEQCFAHNTA